MAFSTEGPALSAAICYYYLGLYQLSRVPGQCIRAVYIVSNLPNPYPLPCLKHFSNFT